MSKAGMGVGVMSSIYYCAGQAREGGAYHLVYRACTGALVVHCGAGEREGKRARPKIKSPDISIVTCKRCAVKALELLTAQADRVREVLGEADLPKAMAKAVEVTAGMIEDLEASVDPLRDRPDLPRSAADLVALIDDDSTSEDW